MPYATIPNVDDEIKDLISQTIRALSGENDYDSLLADVQCHQIRSFRFTVEVDRVTTLHIGFKSNEFREYVFFFPADVAIAAAEIVRVWGLPAGADKQLRRIDVYGESNQPVEWSGTGYVLRSIARFQRED